MNNLTFKQAVLPSGEINDTRWREYPTPKRERDGYTIACYEYKKKSPVGPRSCGPEDKCDPYYVVYFDSEHITHDKKDYKTLTEAKNAANKHNQELRK